MSIDVSSELSRLTLHRPTVSSALKIVQPSQVAPQPWANGGGHTRTLLAWPDQHRWAVRISVADVERDGPFSVFAGVDRWLAVLEGDGVRLSAAGQAPVVVLAADEEMHAFRGDDATECALLGGATRDLNVMTRRDAAHAAIRPLRVSRLCSDAELLASFVCDEAEIMTGRGAPMALAPHTLAWLENPARETLTLQLSAPAPRGWWIEARRADPDDDQAD